MKVKTAIKKMHAAYLERDEKSIPITSIVFSNENNAFKSCCNSKTKNKKPDSLTHAETIVTSAIPQELKNVKQINYIITIMPCKNCLKKILEENKGKRINIFVLSYYNRTNIIASYSKEKIIWKGKIQFSLINLVDYSNDEELQKNIKEMIKSFQKYIFDQYVRRYLTSLANSGDIKLTINENTRKAEYLKIIKLNKIKGVNWSGNTVKINSTALTNDLLKKHIVVKKGEKYVKNEKW